MGRKTDTDIEKSAQGGSTATARRTVRSGQAPTNTLSRIDTQTGTITNFEERVDESITTEEEKEATSVDTWQ